MKIRWPLRRVDRTTADLWVDDPADPAAGLLERFADEQLSPDPAELVRVGSNLQAVFARSITKPAPRAAPTMHTPRRMRALAAVCVVAVLMVSTAGLAAAQSGPGEPFYRVRLQAEALFLPPAGSPDRLEADLSRAEARLNEATRAHSSGNWNGEADAMGAYADVVGSLSMPDDPALRRQAQQRLGVQLATVEGLGVAAPEDGGPQIRRAIRYLDSLIGATPAPTAEPSSATTATDPTPTQAAGSSSGQGPKASPTGAGGQPSGAGPGGPGGGHGSGGQGG